MGPVIEAPTFSSYQKVYDFFNEHQGKALKFLSSSSSPRALFFKVLLTKAYDPESLSQLGPILSASLVDIFLKLRTGASLCIKDIAVEAQKLSEPASLFFKVAVLPDSKCTVDLLVFSVLSGNRLPLNAGSEVGKLLATANPSFECYKNLLESVKGIEAVKSLLLQRLEDDDEFWLAASEWICQKRLAVLDETIISRIHKLESLPSNFLLLYQLA